MHHPDVIRDLLAPAKGETGRSEKPMRPKSAYRVILLRYRRTQHNMNLSPDWVHVLESTGHVLDYSLYFVGNRQVVSDRSVNVPNTDHPGRSMTAGAYPPPIPLRGNGKDNVRTRRIQSFSAVMHGFRYPGGVGAS